MAESKSTNGQTTINKTYIYNVKQHNANPELICNLIYNTFTPRYTEIVVGIVHCIDILE